MPTAVPTPRVYVPLAGPDYGLHVFVWGHPDTTGRDLRMASEAGFHWQKTLFQWRQIEGGARAASTGPRPTASSRPAPRRRQDHRPPRLSARLGAQGRRDNGPPDNYQDYADFVSRVRGALLRRLDVGRVDAIEIWNEVNLDREWGKRDDQPSSRRPTTCAC